MRDNTKCCEGSQQKSKSKSKTKKNSRKLAAATPPLAPPLSSVSWIAPKIRLPKRTASASPRRALAALSHLSSPMEVEVKLRLADADAHRRVTALLSPFRAVTHRQQNLFFDGAGSELSARRAVLRLRFYNGDERCVVSLKAKAALVDGVSRVEEDEEDIDPRVGLDCVAEPGKLGAVESRVLGRVKEECGVVGADKGFVALGGFGNVRSVYDWKGLKLEVDETKFDFGTLYEIECESADPEGAKQVLEEFLKENGIDYSYSTASKFAIFRAGKLL